MSIYNIISFFGIGIFVLIGFAWICSAATLACLLTACVTGTFFTDGSILFSN